MAPEPAKLSVMAAPLRHTSDVTVMLVTKTSRGEEFPKMDLANVVAEMERYGDLLRQAQEVTFFPRRNECLEATASENTCGRSNWDSGVLQ